MPGRTPSEAPKITTFYSDTLGANLTNIRWSWGALNPTTNRVFIRVWEDQFEADPSGVERVLVLGSNWSRSPQGYGERKRHLDLIRNGAEGYGVVCTAKDPEAERRKIASFDGETLVRLGGFIEVGAMVYARVGSRVPVHAVASARTSHASVVPDIKSILRRRVESTIREALADARVGQGAFRAEVLAQWGDRCCVTGSATLDAVRASQIKPWRDSSDSERLDPENGLPLIATLDALFDAGLITFSEAGHLLISHRLSRGEIELLGIHGTRLARAPSAGTANYLEYHRSQVFQDASE